MLVIIPNPNQALELVRLQKKIIENYSDLKNTSETGAESFPGEAPDNSILFQASPLWIFISGSIEYDLQSLKKLSKNIKSLKVNAPEYDEKGNVLCQAELCLQDSGTEKKDFDVNSENKKKCLKGNIVLCKSLKKTEGPETKKNCRNKSGNLFEASNMNFPVNLKVFRLANAVQPDELSCSVTDSLWCRIK